MMLLEPIWVIAQDLIIVTFEDIDTVWLRSIWKDERIARNDMIEILISLALLKLRFRLWSADFFFLRQCYLNLWSVTPFDDGSMTNTLWWLSMLWGFITSLVNVVWMLNYWFLFPILLVKSSTKIFLLQREMLKSLSLFFVRDRARSRIMRSITSQLICLSGSSHL